MVGPVAMAAIFGRTGSYDLGLILFPLCPVVAFVLLYFASVSLKEIQTRAVPVTP
jgi:hypothetical protein